MKTLPGAIAAVVLIVFGTLASGTAMADRYGHGHGRSHGFGGNVRFGVSLGFPLFAPAYYPSRYYASPYAYPYAYPAYAYPAPVYGYPRAAIGYSSPPVYVERGVAEAAPAPAQAQAQGDWYYCAESRAYYPYVGECPAGWQRVPAQASSR